MALTSEFMEAVDSKKYVDVKIMLKDQMLIDTSLESFREMLSYAEERMPELFDEHDGEVFIDDSSQWNESYMNKEMVALVYNFSRERITFLCKMVTKLYASTSIDEVNDDESNQKTESNINGTQVAGGVVTVAGVCALVVGIVESSTPIAIAGGVAAAGGIVIALLGGKNGK